MLWKSNEQHCHIVVVIKKGKVWKVKNVKLSSSFSTLQNVKISFLFLTYS